MPNALRRSERLPIVDRFPALAPLPRASLGRFPTPVQRATALAPDLWVKRDDASGDEIGGNKVRALEFLLGDVERGDDVVTVGATGSTHALSTATYAKRLGARVQIFRWPQEPSEGAKRIAQRTREVADRVVDARSVAGAYAAATVARLRGARWIPAGGSSPLGALGHVNAALELANQIAKGIVPVPSRIVVPLGSGGTVAGLLLGLAIARIDAEILGVRVVPRLVANRGHVRQLAHRTRRLLEKIAGEKIPAPDTRRLRVVHEYYGGAYGRDTREARDAAERFSDWSRGTLDTTYSAKAFAAALAVSTTAGEASAKGPTLFWLTFDGRWL